MTYAGCGAMAGHAGGPAGHAGVVVTAGHAGGPAGHAGVVVMAGRVVQQVMLVL